MPKHRTYMLLRLPAGAHGAQGARACVRSAYQISGPHLRLFILSPRHPFPPHSVSWPFTIHELIAAVAVSQFSGHTERRRASSGALAITGSLRFGL